MTPTNQPDFVEREVFVAARPDIVFSFFTDPEKMIRWKGIEAELDPQPGGIYRVNIDGRHTASGTYQEVVPHERIVFSWGWENEDHPVRPGQSTVEITLIPEGEGTRVRLRHSGLPADQREAHTGGWDYYLARLVPAGAGKDPGPDPRVAAAATEG